MAYCSCNVDIKDMFANIEQNSTMMPCFVAKLICDTLFMQYVCVPAEGVWQDIHRLVEWDVPEHTKGWNGYHGNEKKWFNEGGAHLNTLIHTKKTLSPKIQVE